MAEIERVEEHRDERGEPWARSIQGFGDGLEPRTLIAQRGAATCQVATGGDVAPIARAQAILAECEARCPGCSATTN